MTAQIASNTETGTVHIKDESVARKDWQNDVCECGHTSHATRDVTLNNAANVVENLCGSCKANADDDTLMQIYELADEAGM